MSLMVWLPLNGSLDNIGASDVTVTNNGATIDNNGKIGKCYSFDGTDDYLVLDKPTVADWPEMSITCWCYPTNTFGDLFLLRADGGAHRFKISSSGCVFRDTNHSNQQQVVLNTLPPTNTWTHLAVIYNRGEIFIYINGVLDNHSTDYYNSSSTLINDVLTTRIGRIQSTSGNDYYTGKLNDFRIYNHALSAAEVHEISQGLVLHYKLDSFNNNLFSSVPKAYSPTAYQAYQLNLSENLVSGQTYTFQFWNVNVSHSAKTESTLGFGIWWGGGSVQLANVQGTSYFTNGHADYIKMTVTITSSQASGSGAANAWICVYNSYPSADGTRNMSIGAWKVEKSNIATPWCLSQSEGGNVIRDSSGYNNNGTVSTNPPTIISSQGRYSTAMSFNGTDNYICAGRGGMVRDAITVNIWGYKNPWDTAGRIVSCTEGGGWNFENGSNYVRFQIGSGETSNTYVGVTSSVTWASLSSGWHMFTGTWNGLVSKIYVDGILKGTGTALATKTPAYYHSSNGIFLGAEAAGTATTPAGTYWAGGIGDFRVYATALSDADIKALYEVGAKVDNKGNIHCYEFQENNTSKIIKQGIIQGKLFSEFGGMSYLKYDPNLYIEPDGSVWVHIFHHNNPASKLFNSTDTFTSSVYIDADRWFNVELCNYLDKWEIMFKGKYTSDGTEWKTRWIQQYNPMTATFANVAPANITKITTTGYTATESTVGGLYKRTYDSSYTYLCTNTGTESSWWGAVGSWTHYQSGIPGWFTGSKTVTTSGYNDMYIRIDNITITKPTIAKSTKNNIWLSSEFIET